MSKKLACEKSGLPLRQHSMESEKLRPSDHSCSLYLRALLEHTGDPILICDEQGIPQLFNSSYAALMHKVYGLEMRPGILPHKLLEDPDAVSYWDSLHEKALAGESFKAQYTHRFNDNEIRHYEFTVCPIYEGLKIKGFSAVATDITSIKSAEEALLESEERFRTLFDSSPTAMLISTVESGLVIDANQELCTLANRPKADLIGKETSELISIKEGTRSLFIETLTSRGTLNGKTVEVVVKDGTNRAADMFSRLISLSGKSHIISSLIDVTDSRQLELRLRQTQKMEAVGTLTAGIAHDYNNMLTVILGNISLAKQVSGQGNKISKFLDSAEKASLKIKQLTSELMALAQGGDLKLKPGNLQGLLRDAAACVGGNSLLQVKELIPNRLWPVLHDSGRLKFVLQNIITNAAESMPGGGKIILEAQNINTTTLQQKKGFPLADGSYVKISIIDQGIGIPAEALPRIFDPYFSTKEKGEKKGLGLGLATSYNIIKKHDGYIAIESEVGKGTTVTLYLPAITDRVTGIMPQGVS